MTFTCICATAQQTQDLASALGKAVKGGEVFAFYSDLGGGKTTFVKGLAKGMGVTDVVQSPTFTISQIHQAKQGLELHHFDFYRLQHPGIMSAELAESLEQRNAVVAIEWGQIVHDILPKHYVHIRLQTSEDESRTIKIDCPDVDRHIIEALQNYQQDKEVS